MIRVAIASENTRYDAELYRVLAARLLETEVRRWESAPPVSFSGWKHVWRQAPLYLDLAAHDEVRHAIVAIDNDGGARRRPPHEDGHDVAAQAADPQDGCGTCLLIDALRDTWVGVGHRKCIVVPVQAMETWLLVLRGFQFPAPTPEQHYHRRALRTQFFGPHRPQESERTGLALIELRKPDAIDVLRQRPSFRYFEQQLQGWR